MYCMVLKVLRSNRTLCRLTMKRRIFILVALAIVEKRSQVVRFVHFIQTYRTNWVDAGWYTRCTNNFIVADTQTCNDGMIVLSGIGRKGVESIVQNFDKGSKAATRITNFIEVVNYCRRQECITGYVDPLRKRVTSSRKRAFSVSALIARASVSRRASISDAPTLVLLRLGSGQRHCRL